MEREPEWQRNAFDLTLRSRSKTEIEISTALIDVHAAMASTSTLRDVDAIVVGGLGRAPTSTGCDADVARVSKGLGQSGLTVSTVRGSDQAGVDSLAEALEHAVLVGNGGTSDDDDESTDVNVPSERKQRKQLKVVVVLGLDAVGPIDNSKAGFFLHDELLKHRTQKFAMSGGCVLLHGVGGALDQMCQEWFRKPWTSGLTRNCATWRYNNDAAWGDGFFAKFQAVSVNGKPIESIELEKVAELESVSPAERVYERVYTDTLVESASTATGRENSNTEPLEAHELKGPVDTEREKETENQTKPQNKQVWSGYKHDDDDFSENDTSVNSINSVNSKKKGVCVAFGSYGGGYVGCFVDLRCEAFSVATVRAFASASGGVTKNSLAKLKKSRLWKLSEQPFRKVGTVGLSGQHIQNVPSTVAFFAYAVVTTLVTSVFFFFVARAILKS